MKIGKPRRVYTVEPVRTPVPAEPERSPEPKEPAKPVPSK
jgi:hypothetical protein